VEMLDPSVTPLMAKGTEIEITEESYFFLSFQTGSLQTPSITKQRIER
jgi:hypothetical protein